MKTRYWNLDESKSDIFECQDEDTCVILVGGPKYNISFSLPVTDTPGRRIEFKHDPSYGQDSDDGRHFHQVNWLGCGSLAGWQSNSFVVFGRDGKWHSSWYGDPTQEAMKELETK